MASYRFFGVEAKANAAAYSRTLYPDHADFVRRLDGQRAAKLFGRFGVMQERENVEGYYCTGGQALAALACPEDVKRSFGLH